MVNRRTTTACETWVHPPPIGHYLFLLIVYTQLQIKSQPAALPQHGYSEVIIWAFRVLVQLTDCSRLDLRMIFPVGEMNVFWGGVSRGVCVSLMSKLHDSPTVQYTWEWYNHTLLRRLPSPILCVVQQVRQRPRAWSWWDQNLSHVNRFLSIYHAATSKIVQVHSEFISPGDHE